VLLGQIGLSIGSFSGALEDFARIIYDLQTHPDIKLALRDAYPEQMEALMNGKIDIAPRALLSHLLVHLARLLYRDPIVVVLPRDHPLAGRIISRWSDLRAVCPCDRQMTPRSSMASLLLLCCGLRQILSIPATWWVLTLVESGEGVALVPSGALSTPASVVISVGSAEHAMGLAVAWSPRMKGRLCRISRLVRENKDRIQRSNGN
jgi:DNA-binding transcriptional LysR family regulator